MKNLHCSVLKLVGILSSCKNNIMKVHYVFYFIKLKNRDQPMQGNLTLYSGFFVSGTWIPDSSYKWDPEYFRTFIPDSKRKISQIPDMG